MSLGPIKRLLVDSAFGDACKYRQTTADSQHHPQTSKAGLGLDQALRTSYISFPKQPSQEQSQDPSLTLPARHQSVPTVSSSKSFRRGLM